MTRLEIERAFRDRAWQRRMEAFREFNRAEEMNPALWLAWISEQKRHEHIIGMTPAVDEEARIAVDRCCQ